MKSTVYIETTIVSYLTARPSRDLYTAALQQRTQAWWERERHQFDLVSSELTRIEAAAGDAQAAAARLVALKSMPLLAIKDEATTALAERLVTSGAFPSIAARDALHVAICASNGVRYLLTWNFKHLANVLLRDKITDTCERAGVAAPLICTPDELTEVP